MKNYIRQSCKVIIFCLGFAVLYQKISLIVQVYGTEEYKADRRSCLFFEMPKNTVDVLFLGTSHVYCSYIPKQIYENAGITSASLATSAQSFQNSYWLLKEALKYQKPQIVILDIHPITTYEKNGNDYIRLHFTSGVSIMPDLSINKYLAYVDIKNAGYGWAPNMTIYDAYSILEYRSEYMREKGTFNELFNILIKPESEYKTFGYNITDSVYPMDELKPYRDEGEAYIYDMVEFKYLNKILELTQENNVELLLTRAPYNACYGNKNAYEQAFEWTEQNDITIIDYFALLDETGINPATDFEDVDHLNYLGAKKATRYLTEYLVDNYNLTDHRGDKKYSIWEENEFDYLSIEKIILEQIQNN